MQITNVEISEIKIPLRVPFQTALRTADMVNDILVRITTDTGEYGYGEAPPTAAITGETKESISAAILGYIQPSLIGMDIENMESIMNALHSSICHNTSAKAAVDMAIYDLAAKKQKIPLFQYLGGYCTHLETDVTISINHTQKMIEDSLDAISRGFRILKLKVGKEGKKDIDRLLSIREAVGPDIILRIDANQGWNVKEAISIITSLEKKNFNADLVEQPVPARNLIGLKEITQNVSTPILADESVFSPADALTVIETHAADLLNIKLMKTGGIYAALQLCAIAEAAGIECMIGCMLESKLSVSAAAHLAAAKKIITRVDLDGPFLCKTDPYQGGPCYEEGRITLPQNSPGLGFSDLPVNLSWRST